MSLLQVVVVRMGDSHVETFCFSTQAIALTMDAMVGRAIFVLRLIFHRLRKMRVVLLPKPAMPPAP
jgi:hypothetical protein